MIGTNDRPLSYRGTRGRSHPYTLLIATKTCVAAVRHPLSGRTPYIKDNLQLAALAVSMECWGIREVPSPMQPMTHHPRSSER
jgi:hypothetical protein